MMKGCAKVVKGLTNTSSSYILTVARTFAEARLAARTSTAREYLGPALRVVVRAEPLHLDQANLIIGLHSREDLRFVPTSRSRPSPINLTTSSPFTTVGEGVSDSTSINNPPENVRCQ
ncbi:hypothetical protein Pcinc_017019 [Petrolisthes cinctipes]|uniref:Uncharacterized protein n=1 Tax=Petrolisthes cinctipes TaxID=88211 RepID=A0AAE1FRS5_PETCI|nr:hypothetical protein Pcinc_017019 [Petrolisthes cinctipes]